MVVRTFVCGFKVQEPFWEMCVLLHWVLLASFFEVCLGVELNPRAKPLTPQTFPRLWPYTRNSLAVHAQNPKPKTLDPRP